MAYNPNKNLALQIENQTTGEQNNMFYDRESQQPRLNDSNYLFPSTNFEVISTSNRPDLITKNDENYTLPTPNNIPDPIYGGGGTGSISNPIYINPIGVGTSVISEPDLGEPIIVNSDNLLEDEPDKKDVEVKDIDISIPTSEDENGNVINDDNSKDNIISKKPNYIFIGLAGVVGILIIYKIFFNKKTE